MDGKGVLSWARMSYDELVRCQLITPPSLNGKILSRLADIREKQDLILGRSGAVGSPGMGPTLPCLEVDQVRSVVPV